MAPPQDVGDRAVAAERAEQARSARRHHGQPFGRLGRTALGAALVFTWIAMINIEQSMPKPRLLAPARPA
jgi:hypothetical protein